MRKGTYNELRELNLLFREQNNQMCICEELRIKDLSRNLLTLYVSEVIASDREILSCDTMRFAIILNVKLNRLAKITP